ncbi:SAM-dependent methyltransferase [Symbioplanes lichenis]|uniref:SAM-dependent methyltransferase n=1 Tax=Symbioplanes lichenis TaxID=1629072 RepID=UPI002738A36E|nr:SAM-dependent methyltransferase [Actinoplanes lichenis]
MDLRPEVPHAARIWNYWMGGKDNFAADRAAGDAVARVYPEIATMARVSRGFLIRAVRHLAFEAGIDQFLDIGTGLPTMQNTHEVAPAARVVYVDNDPMVLAHARALLNGSRYIQADYHDPGRILTQAAEVLDFDRPVAVMFMGVLGYEPDLELVRSIVDRTVAGLVPGSHLVLWDGTNTSPEVVRGSERLAQSGGVPYILRSPEEIGSLFGDFRLLPPGLTQITQWRPDEADPEYIDAYGAVGVR